VAKRGYRRSRGRNINGVFLLDKPKGLSSNEALQKVKRLFGASKAGHTGSLDPLATGMLPICFGEATKFSKYMLEADKVYVTTAKLGITTDSGDAEGQVTSEQPVTGVDQATVEQALEQFRGEITQLPSMFSAIKVDGEPLYIKAREGKEVERPSRQVMIYKLELLAFRDDEVDLEVHCSKGTYIRTLVEDLGQVLGCGAHVSMLHRTCVGGFAGQSMHALAAVQEVADNSADWAAKNAILDPWLLPIRTALQLPVVEVSDLMAVYLRQGQSVFVPNTPHEGEFLLINKDVDEKDEFLGIGFIDDDGKVAPRRLIAE